MSFTTQPTEIVTHDGAVSPETGQVWQYTQRIYRFDNGYGLNVITNYDPELGMTDLWDAAIVKDGVFNCPFGDVDRMRGLDEAKVEDIVTQVEAIPAPPTEG